MNTHLNLKVLTASLVLTIAWVSTLADDAPAKSQNPPIYDTKADGAKQVSDALAVAKRENKNVLLQFGADWCGWCHKLQSLFETNKEIATVLKTNYVTVLVDVSYVDGKNHNAEINDRYGNPSRFGLPALVVLDPDGKPLTTQDTNKLEQGDHHDPAKVMKFLQDWSPTKSNGK